jgi:CYTH domain-containing protein
MMPRKKSNNTHTEIERRFLIKKHPDISTCSYQDITQGYIDGGKDFIIRLRQVIYMDNSGSSVGDQYYWTIKGEGDLKRVEREVILLRNQFHVMWPPFQNHSLRKLRYEIKSGDNIIELDIFKNELNGLILAEVEFKNEDEALSYIPETWFDEEVTYNKNYSNYYIAKNGFENKEQLINYIL